MAGLKTVQDIATSPAEIDSKVNTLLTDYGVESSEIKFLRLVPFGECLTLIFLMFDSINEVRTYTASFTMSDALSKRFNAIREHAAVVTMLDTVLVFVNMSDSVSFNLVEALVIKAISKIKTDSVALTDSITTLLTNVRDMVVETGTLVEAFIKSLIVEKSEAFSLADTLIKTLAGDKTETPTISDTPVDVVKS